MDDVPITVPSGPPQPAGLFTVWTWQPVALLLAVLAVAAYARGVARTPRWPVRRTFCFGLGVALLVWTSCGFLEVYGHVLFWVWTVQMLLLLLVVPLVLLAGQPVELARRHGRALGRLPATRVGRVITSPLVGPLLVPVVSALLVFGPVAGAVVAVPPVEWVVQLLVLAAGAAVALPLASPSTRMTSLAVGVALAVGVFELLLDAVPGFVLRLQTHLTTSFFDLRPAALPGLSALRDQQRAGGILWVVAELLDLPFVVLVFRQWLRADAREAATIDTVLEAESIARGAPPAAPDGVGETTPPWWTTDPRLRDRYR